MASRVFKSKIVVPKETFIDKNIDQQDNTQREQCLRDEAIRAKTNRRIAAEQEKIKTLATRKVETKEYIQDELQLPGDDDYDRGIEDAMRKSNIKPTLYSRRGSKALSKTLSIKDKTKNICKEPISREELVKYIQRTLPDYFSFGDVPSSSINDGDSFIGYHLTRVNTQQIPVYSLYTTSLVKIPGRLEKYAGTRPNRDSDLKYSRGLIEKDQEARYVPKFKYLYDPDVIIEENTVNGILENYTPGMILDPAILTGVLRDRINCTSSLHGYSETRSYNIFEGYLAAGLELKEEAPLVYLIGIFDYPSTGRNLYDICIAEDRSCNDNLIDTISSIRDLYWNSSDGENDMKAPESLRR